MYNNFLMVCFKLNLFFISKFHKRMEFFKLFFDKNLGFLLFFGFVCLAIIFFCLLDQSSTLVTFLNITKETPFFLLTYFLLKLAIIDIFGLLIALSFVIYYLLLRKDQFSYTTHLIISFFFSNDLFMVS